MKYRLIIVICGLFNFYAYSQPGDPGGDPDNVIPITGVEILLAGGAALGLNRLLKSKRTFKD
ncbi:MAG: hypothetical protein ABIK73_08600 [candidate division WOR-3 bacterium]